MNWPLLKIVGHPVTIGFASFIAARIALSPFVGKQICRDGWHSFSIGIQGACSSHGGVGGLDHGSWVFPLSIMAGIAVGLWRANRRARGPAEPPASDTEAKPATTSYKTREQVQAELDEFFASRKTQISKNPPG